MSTPTGPGDSTHLARWWHREPDGRLQCELCPRDCRLLEGQRGFCFVRKRSGDALVLSTYGRSSGFAIDPIEKKPLAHFFPGSSVLSFGTAGCNLSCKFCQNWDLSRARDMARLADEASPEAIARAADEAGCRSVAFTYNDPTIFAEYAMDVADACHARGLQTVAVTAGYIHAQPRHELYAKIDAANVDLKGFSESFYRELTGAHLQPVLETIEYLVQETDVWTELTTLLLPGKNDSDAELERLTAWIRERLGPHVPLHFSAFHPAHHLADLPPTPAATLQRARRIALAAGLSYVYTGNLRDPAGEVTSCASCGTALIERDWYELLAYRLDEQGRCPTCALQLHGRFDAKAGAYGTRSVRVAVSG